MLDQVPRDIPNSSEDLSSQPEEISSKYVVHLPIFEGPLDLLLHLIEKRQMEITTISLVAVTDQYLAYMQQWNTTDYVTEYPQGVPLHSDERALSKHLYIEYGAEVARMSNMAAFVSIAARLLFIKSQSLLPRTSSAEMCSEAESAAIMAEELQRHLLEYKAAKEIATHLRQREALGLQTYGRSGLLAGIEAQLAWTPPTLVGLEAETLSRAFQRLLARLAKDEVTTADAMFLPIARVRVSERIAEISSWLSERPSVLLEEVLANEHSRFVIIVTFLAVLEMWKYERIHVRQETLLGSILLERGEKWAKESNEEYA